MTQPFNADWVNNETAWKYRAGKNIGCSKCSRNDVDDDAVNWNADSNAISNQQHIIKSSHKDYAASIPEQKQQPQQHG